MKKRHPLLVFFMAGIAMGIIVTIVFRGSLSDNACMIENGLFEKVKSTGVDRAALFCCSLRNRIIPAAVLLFLSTTYAGAIACVIWICGYGLAVGCFISSVFCELGIRGFWMVLAAIFPHCIIFIPASVFLIKLCANIFYMREKNKSCLPQLILRMTGLILFNIIGCVLEGYVNPYAVYFVLSFF